MTDPIYTDPFGNVLFVHPDGDGAYIGSPTGVTIPPSGVQEFATSVLKAVCAATGLPEPEVVFQHGSSPFDDDWQPYEAGRAVSMQAGGDQ